MRCTYTDIYRLSQGLANFPNRFRWILFSSIEFGFNLVWLVCVVLVLLSVVLAGLALVWLGLVDFGWVWLRSIEFGWLWFGFVGLRNFWGFGWVWLGLVQFDCVWLVFCRVELG